MKQSMSTKKLSAIIQISELDQMLTDLKQTIDNGTVIARLQQMILEKRQSAIGYRDFIVLKNSQEELRELCKKIDLRAGQNQ